MDEEQPDIPSPAEPAQSSPAHTFVRDTSAPWAIRLHASNTPDHALQHPQEELVLDRPRFVLCVFVPRVEPALEGPTFVPYSFVL